MAGCCRLWLLVALAVPAARGPAAAAYEDPGRFGEVPAFGDDMRWEDTATWRDMPGGVVWCGYQYPGDDVARRERSYIARVYRGGSIVPGKATYWGAAAAVANSTFTSVTSYQVALVNPQRVAWVAAYNGNIPPGAPSAGLTREGQPLYVCKFHHERRLSMACGAVQRYTERCVAEMDGQLVSSPVYEVLVLTTGGFEEGMNERSHHRSAVPVVGRAAVGSLPVSGLAVTEQGVSATDGPREPRTSTP
ncbi:uncharacterized protein LOC113206176 [Frankliniella occidentalis]|uniref:Uncharacterized protein LOC113206176 n=1 Tax=Frankliniella occidentalis TaxID=133901 RepID=A0A6J1SA31_FRAOC|nr:uncharacterized protein LOC113206176 [Frankliniella occidentalis]